MAGFEGGGGSLGKSGPAGSNPGQAGGNSKSDMSKERGRQAGVASGSTIGKKGAQTQEHASAVANHVERTSGFSGFLNDIFGVKNRVAKNPNTGQWDIAISKEINPTSTIASAVLGPVAGQVAGIGMQLAGIEDPLGFEIDLGFASEQKPAPERNEQRDSREFISDVRGASNKAISDQLTKQSPIDEAVAKIAQSPSEFKFFDMPAFKQLNADFGSDIEKLLKEKV